MKCQEVELLLYDGVDGTLAPADKGPLTAHLRECAGCRRILSGLTKLEEVYRRLPMPAAVPATRRKSAPVLRSRIFLGAGIAAALLVGLAVGWALKKPSAQASARTVQKEISQLPKSGEQVNPAPEPAESAVAPQPKVPLANKSAPALEFRMPWENAPAKRKLQYEKIDIVERMTDAEIKLADAETTDQKLGIMKGILADLINECKASLAEEPAAAAEYVQSTEEFVQDGLVPLVRSKDKASRSSLQELTGWLDGACKDLEGSQVRPVDQRYVARLSVACDSLRSVTRQVMEDPQ